MKYLLHLILGFSILSTGASFAQSFGYSLEGDPVDITDWSIGGTAIVDGDAIRLTDATTNQNGYIHYSDPQILSGECAYFTVDFDYKIETVSSSGPADGLAFWFLEDPPVGFVSGSGIGMPAMLNGFALIFDTYNNSGPSNVPTISIRKFNDEPYTEDASSTLVGAELTFQTQITDGTWRHARLEYHLGTINLYLDGATTPNITGALDLSGIEGYFGFSASTGASYEYHHIKNVFIAGAENPPAPTVTIPEKHYCQYDEIPALEVDEMLPDGILHWYDVATGGTELEEVPTIDSSAPGEYVFYVSQSRLLCPIESDRTMVTIIVRPKPQLEIELSVDRVCLGGSVELEAIINPEPDEGFTFGWTPEDGLSSASSLTTTATPDISTEYTFYVSTGPEGCDTSASVYIQVIPNNIDVFNEDTIVCAGTVIPINATFYPGFHYSWTPALDIEDPHSSNTALTARESGWVRLIASHPGCEDVSDSFYVEVQPVPVLDLGKDHEICMGDTIHFYAATTPEYDDYTYEWMPGMKLTDSTIKNPTFIGFSDQTYIVNVTTPYGCTDRDTVIVKVNRSDFLNTNIKDTTVCAHQPLQLLASGAVSYQWTPAIGLDNDTIANPVFDFGGSMTYTLIGVSEGGCLDTQIVNIFQASDAVVHLPDSVEIFPGEQYEMETVSNGHYFSWFPPEGLSDINIANPLVSPAIRTRYFVTAQTENGCEAVDSIDVIVNLEAVWDMPNAFVTGNDDSHNPYFKVKTRGLVQLQYFRVYNRWGNLVFETTDINEGWDGTYQGTAQPAGVYVYQVEAVNAAGNPIRKEGNVTLIR